MSAFMMFKLFCVIFGFMIEAIAINYTDKCLALPMVAIGATPMIWGVQL